MKADMVVLSLVVGAAHPACAIDLFLVGVQDVAPLTDPGNPALYVGTNVSAISLVGNDLFVAGYNRTTGTTLGQCVKIEGIDFASGTCTYRAMPDTQITLNPFRGYYGCTFDWGPARAGLVIAYDAGVYGPAGQYKLFDVSTQLSPILLERSPAGGIRGVAGPAFDYGGDGFGFDSDGDAVSDGPVLGVLDFSNYGGVQEKGPFGVRLHQSVTGISDDALTALGTGRIYDGNSVNSAGDSAAPVMDADPVCDISGTNWRDLAIDPRDGTMAARASNDLVIVRRNVSDGNASVRTIDLNGGCGSGNVPGGSDNFAFQVLQRVEMVYGFGGTDFTVINDYGAAGTNLSTWAKGFDYDGNPVTLGFWTTDGGAVAPPNSGGIYDYSWDPVNRRLAVSDFANRKVYVFTTDVPVFVCPCAADFDGSGGTPDGGDVDAYFAAWLLGEPGGDTNCSGGTPDATDIDLFFQQWLMGGC